MVLLQEGCVNCGLLALRFIQCYGEVEYADSFDLLIKSLFYMEKLPSTDIKAHFANGLNNQLQSYYRRIPSASILARDFNSRLRDGMNPITQETARRWIRGLSMPEMDKLQILIQWLDLNIDLNEEALPSSTADDLSQQSGESAKKSVVLNEAELSIVRSFRQTDLRGKRVMLSVAKALIQS